MKTSVRVKLIKDDNEERFVRYVNEFLNKMHPDDVVDIQYNVYNGVYFSALISYKVLVG